MTGTRPIARLVLPNRAFALPDHEHFPAGDLKRVNRRGVALNIALELRSPILRSRLGNRRAAVPRMPAIDTGDGLKVVK
jgi:hypothetical protein